MIRKSLYSSLSFIMIIGLLLSCGKDASDKEGFDVELAKNIRPITIPKDDTKVKRDIYSFFTNLTAKKYGVTLALKEKYTGVTIDKNTAELVVDSTASPGGVTIVASRPTSNDYLGGIAEARVVLQNADVDSGGDMVPAGKPLDLTGKISKVSNSVPTGTSSFNRFDHNDTHFGLGKGTVWGTGNNVPARESFRQYHSVWVEEDGSLTIAWMNIDGNPSKDVKDKDGNPVTLDKEASMGQTLMLSQAGSNGMMSSTITLVKHIDNNELTGSFSGIVKMSDGKYVTAYRRYDDPEKRVTKNEGYIYDPTVGNHNKYPDSGPNFDKLVGKIYGGFRLNDKRKYLPVGCTYGAKGCGWELIDTKNYTRLNVSVFDKTGKNLEASKFYPSDEDLKKSGGISYFRENFKDYDFAFAGTSRIRNLGNNIGIYSTIGVWATKDETQHQTDHFVTFKYNPAAPTDQKIEFVSKKPFINGAHVFYTKMREDSYTKRFVGVSTPEVGKGPVYVFTIDSESGAQLGKVQIDLETDKLNKNNTYTIIGDIAVLKDRYIVSFTTANERKNRDVGILVLDKDLNIKKQAFLTQSTGDLNSNAKWYLMAMCVPYGEDQVLMAWEEVTPGSKFSEPGNTFFAVLDKDGNILEGPTMASKDVYLPLGGDFFTYKNGDIGWVVGTGDKVDVFRYKK